MIEIKYKPFSMKYSSEYPSWELHPRKLTEEEAANPYSVIDSFFTYASLPQIRDELRTWLEITVTGNFPDHSNNEQRNNLIYFYGQIERLIESVYVLHISKQEKK